jgi:hypothetical protein
VLICDGVADSGEGRTRGDRLEAPARAAGARLAVELHDGVAELASAARAAVDLAAREDRAADPGPQRQQERVGRAPGRSGLRLREQRAVRVVVDHDRPVEPLADEVAERHAGERQVNALERHRPFAVHQRRDAEADRLGLRLLRQRLLDDLDEQVEHLLALGSPPQAVEPVMHREPVVHDAREQLRTPRVDPDHSPFGHGRTLYTPDGRTAARQA